MIILKNFENFSDAQTFEDKLKKYGANTKMFATWSRKERRYIITVLSTTV